MHTAAYSRASLFTRGWKLKKEFSQNKQLSHKTGLVQDFDKNFKKIFCLKISIHFTFQFFQNPAQCVKHMYPFQSREQGNIVIN